MCAMCDRDRERSSRGRRLLWAATLGILASSVSVGHSEPETSNHAPLKIAANTVDTDQASGDLFAMPDDASAPAGTGASSMPASGDAPAPAPQTTGADGGAAAGGMEGTGDEFVLPDVTPQAGQAAAATTDQAVGASFDLEARGHTGQGTGDSARGSLTTIFLRVPAAPPTRPAVPTTATTTTTTTTTGTAPAASTPTSAEEAPSASAPTDTSSAPPGDASSAPTGSAPTGDTSSAPTGGGPSAGDA